MFYLACSPWGSQSRQKCNDSTEFGWRRGMVGLIVMQKSHRVKGRGIECRSLSLFLLFELVKSTDYLFLMVLNWLVQHWLKWNDCLFLLSKDDCFYKWEKTWHVNCCSLLHYYTIPTLWMRNCSTGYACSIASPSNFPFALLFSLMLFPMVVLLVEKPDLSECFPLPFSYLKHLFHTT